MFSQTLFILGLSPFFEVCSGYMQRRLKFFLDTGFILKPSKQTPIQTSAKTVQQFINRYSGPEMRFHYRYAFIMVSIFMPMIYGAGLPLLFPITLFNLCVLFTIDRLMTVYVYQKPPAFDAQLTQTCLNILQYAALPYVIVGYWMLSNKQIFSNTIYPISRFGEVI